MNFLSAENLSKSFDQRLLFGNINLGLSQGQKVALVGANGAGKSTLLKILAGKLEPDSGEVQIKSGINTQMLLQVPDLEQYDLVEEALYPHSNPVAKAVRKYNKIMADPNPNPDVMQEAMTQMEELHAWDYESKMHQVAANLGVPDHRKSISELSGGQKKRLALAQVVLHEAELLILDEPTNHLDIEAIEWLEGFLSTSNTTLLMISHDRYFIDAVVNEIWELDSGKVFSHKGNYAFFLEKRAERYENLGAVVAKAKNLYKKELDWMRRQPKARGTKAKYRVDAFSDTKKLAHTDLSKEELNLQTGTSRQGKKILELKDIKKSFDEKEIIKSFSYVFKGGEKIGLVGKNGSGKSTFLNLLTGELQPDSGELDKGQNTKIGYFTQEGKELNTANRAIEEVKEIAEFIPTADGKEMSASRFLETFGFDGDKQYTYIEKLSGGEKKRIQLLKILISNPNFLILDEPTNDLDLDTLNALESFLENFQGTLILVSHDRYLMDRLVDHLFVLPGDGTVMDYNGNYTDYRQDKKESEKTKKTNTPSNKKKARKEDREDIKEKRKLHQKLEKEIDKLELEKTSLLKFFEKDDNDPQTIERLSKELKEAEILLERKTEEWIELGEELESLN